MGLDLVDLVTEHGGSVADATEDTDTTGIGNSSSQLGAGSHVHTSQEDGVVDLEKIGDGSADLLCWGALVLVSGVSGCDCAHGCDTMRCDCDGRKRENDKLTRRGHFDGWYVQTTKNQWYHLLEEEEWARSREDKRAAASDVLSELEERGQVGRNPWILNDQLGRRCEGGVVWPDMCRGSLSWGPLVLIQPHLQRLGCVDCGARVRRCETWAEAPTGYRFPVQSIVCRCGDDG